MPTQPAPPARGPLERAGAWLVMGPLGHGWSAFADLASFFAHSVYARTRIRLARRS